MTDNPDSVINPAVTTGFSYAFGEPRVYGRIRSRVEDFQVDEITAVTPDNEGEHLLLQIRKTSANTDWVAAQLADALNVSRREVSYAGRKDRHAVTTQWFSVRLIGIEPDGWRTRLPENVEVIASHRHRRKLRRGALAGNRFKIVVRNLGGEVESLQARAEHIRSEGVPNYFGEQRFGREGGNLAAAAAMFSQKRRRVQRNRREMLLSAARSHIFNSVLARRVADMTWNQVLPGDVAGLAGSRSIFAVTEVDDDLRVRAANHDIHPTGPLWGRGELQSKGAVFDMESQMAERHKILADGLVKAGVDQGRRNLRMSLPDLTVEIDGDTAELRFTLGPGGYATVLLHELLKYKDASMAQRRNATESAT